MRKTVVMVAVCLLTLCLAAPAYASQGGISDGVFQFNGGNFMKPPTNVRLIGDSASGRLWAGITWCQGYIGYKIDLRGAEAVDTVQLWDGDVMIAADTGIVSRDCLVAEGIIAYDEVVGGDEWFLPNPAPQYFDYPSIKPVYDALASGDLTVVVLYGGATVASGDAR